MRVLSTTFRNKIQAQHNDELILVFAVVTHPQLTKPVRVVTEDIEGVSYHTNGQIINYKYNGDLYQGCPFTFSLLTDDENPPRSKVSIINVDTKIGRTIRLLTSPPRFRFTVLKYSDFSPTVDSDNARSPTGTPTVEYDANYLFLRNVVGDDMVITADITSYQIADEPCPAIRTTQDRTPALYY